jgi:hypothetical protein
MPERMSAVRNIVKNIRGNEIAALEEALNLVLNARVDLRRKVSIFVVWYR